MFIKTLENDLLSCGVEKDVDFFRMCVAYTYTSATCIASSAIWLSRIKPGSSASPLPPKTHTSILKIKFVNRNRMFGTAV